jgi:CheY-like chemotaxis protein
MNIGTNAYHAMGDSGGILAIEIDHVEIHPFDEKATNLQLTPGKYLLLKMCDNGCGMEPAVLDRIFEPYFTTKSKARGTGMGLAVVHGIVKNHDGLISVYSEPGKGTSFLIYLPEYNKENDAEQVEPVKDIEEEAKGGSEHVMVVDDEQMVAKMVQRQLENLGYRVTSFTDPQHAFEHFSKDPSQFSVIMTDMTMPKMNGILLAKEIISLRPDIPIVLCTGFSELVNEEKAQAIGIRAFLMKPLVRKTIADTVRKVLDQE